jgi:hypothetical protein
MPHLSFGGLRAVLDLGNPLCAIRLAKACVFRTRGSTRILHATLDSQFKLSGLNPFRKLRISIALLQREPSYERRFQWQRRKRQKRRRAGGHRTGLVAGGQKYEVRYEAKKTGRSAPAVKKAVKKVCNVRKNVEKRLVRKK